MFEYILTAVIVALSTFIGVWYIQRKAEILIENTKYDIKEEVKTWLNSEVGQKALFTVGAIIGNGAKSGFGISAKSGKFKWQDLLGQIAGNYIQNTFGGGTQGVQNVPKGLSSMSKNEPIKSA